jgi:hypothetical protein
MKRVRIKEEEEDWISGGEVVSRAPEEFPPLGGRGWGRGGQLYLNSFLIQTKEDQCQWGRGRERNATRLSADFGFNAFPKGSGRGGGGGGA